MPKEAPLGLFTQTSQYATPNRIDEEQNVFKFIRRTIVSGMFGIGLAYHSKIKETHSAQNVLQNYSFQIC